MLRDGISNIVIVMGERDWRIPIQEAAVRACDAPYITAAGLAEAAGWNKPQSMTKFLEKATGDEGKVRRLEALLIDLGFLDPDPLRILAAELHGLAWYLRDTDITADARMAYAVETIRLLHSKLEADRVLPDATIENS